MTFILVVVLNVCDKRDDMHLYNIQSEKKDLLQKKISHKIFKILRTDSKNTFCSKSQMKLGSAAKETRMK